MKITLIANLNSGLVGLCYGDEKEITIGREIGNTIAPLAADGLSRRHARIFAKDGKWFVEDLGSTNGSFRLGQKVEGAVELQARDMLQFGKFEISVDEIVTGEAAAPSLPAAPAPAPVAPAPAAVKPAPAAPIAPAIRRPTIPGLKPMNLPPKPTLPAGLKLPPKRPVLPGAKPVAPAPTAAPAPALEPVTPLEPITPLEPLEPVTPLTPIS